MTDHELYTKMQHDRRALPEGFDRRSDLLLQQLTHKERKMNMKKVVLIALAAVLLLGTIAYAATQIDLTAIIFGNGPVTTQQSDYVSRTTQYMPITSVTTGGNTRGEYASESLTSLTLSDAYITNITAFTDGARLVIGFTKTEAGQVWELSCDGFFANGQPIAGGLETRNGICYLDTELPNALSGQALSITLPLHRYRDGKAQGYQYVSFTMEKSSVQFSPEISIQLNEQMKVTLLRGTLSPLGLRVPLKTERGDAVNDYGSYICYVGGEAVADAWQGGTDEADDMIWLSCEQLPADLEIHVTWQEIENNAVYDCRGTAHFNLVEGSAVASDVSRTFAYEQPTRPATSAESSAVATYDLDVTPCIYTLKPRVMNTEQLMMIAEDVMTKEIMNTLTCVDETPTARSYRSDTHNIKAYVYYEPTTGELNIMGPGAVDENRLGAVDAPNCSMTMEDAKKVAEDFMQRFGYTHDMLRIEQIDAFVAAKRGGYYISLNVVDDQTPRYVSREGYIATPWRLMINERGVCQVTGRLVDVEKGAVTTDALSLEAAQQKAEEAVASGTYWMIPAYAELFAIRAVSYIPDMYSWKDEVQTIPVWEFDFREAADSGWVYYQLCVDRQTGEVFYPNERPTAKMEGM